MVSPDELKAIANGPLCDPGEVFLPEGKLPYTYARRKYSKSIKGTQIDLEDCIASLPPQVRA